MLDENSAYEAFMRVRYSAGLKMVGMFGSFRPTKLTDQVDLMSCPHSRRYMFEFMLEGRVSSELLVVQFSFLCTSLTGERYFLIETHFNKVSSHIQQILAGLDYTSINVAYVRGIVHNV